MKLTNIVVILSGLTLLILSSCLGDKENNVDFSEWRSLNEKYIETCEKEKENGSLKYEKVVPDWDKSVFVLMKWHNDRSLNTNRLNPLSNSRITVKYTLTNIEGDTLDSSASFSCIPNTMVTGFWTAVTNMNVNDTVTAIVPYNSGYGYYGSGAVLPYSTLIFGIRLDSIDSLF